MRRHLKLLFLGALVTGVLVEELSWRLSVRYVMRQAEEAAAGSWFWTDLPAEES